MTTTTSSTVQREFAYKPNNGRIAFANLPIQKYVLVTEAVIFIEGRDTAVILKDQSQVVAAYEKGYITGPAEEYTRKRTFNSNSFKVDYSRAVDITSDCPSIEFGIFEASISKEAELQVVDGKLFYVLSDRS